jgi:glucokinase
MLLAGDIGATKARLAIFSKERGCRDPVEEETFASQEYDSIEAILTKFLQGKDIQIRSASFGVAGPVIKGKTKKSNIKWEIDSKSVSKHLEGTPISLFNDLEAIASFIPELQGDEVAVLNKGIPVDQGAIAVIAPGTGLGEAFLIWGEEGYRAYPSEGGNVSFAPTNSLEYELLSFLQEAHGHVSYERVCSGLGIANIYYFLREQKKHFEPKVLSGRLEEVDDPAPAIVDAALDQSLPCEICEETVRLFINVLAAEAGNLALKVMATGGVYLGGGIPPKILPFLKRAQFMQAFTNKGRFSGMMNDIPVKVILNDRAGLYGAAWLGLKSL